MYEPFKHKTIPLEFLCCKYLQNIPRAHINGNKGKDYVRATSSGSGDSKRKSSPPSRASSEDYVNFSGARAWNTYIPNTSGFGTGAAKVSTNYGSS